MKTKIVHNDDSNTASIFTHYETDCLLMLYNRRQTRNNPANCIRVHFHNAIQYIVDSPLFKIIKHSPLDTYHYKAGRSKQINSIKQTFNHATQDNI
jgi:hypothetical protein